MNVKKLAEEVCKEKNANKNSSKSTKLMKKVSKHELSAFQLLKRNIFNKDYHKAKFSKLHS
jgi:hypothetical protein